jgi:hypothetical protein
MRIPTLRPIKFFSIHSIDSEISSLLLYHIEKFFLEHLVTLRQRLYIFNNYNTHRDQFRLFSHFLARSKISNFNFGIANFFSYYFICIFYHVFISCVVVKL